MIWIAIIALVLGVIIGGAFAPKGNLAGLVQFGNVQFPNGITVGDTATLTTAAFTGVVSASAEGNKLGSANSYNPIYVGAGDGCTAILYAASTTLVSSATSTSFCN